MFSAKNISKNFSGVAALTDVTMDFEPGKVTAIIGENGAGKSTLMKILSGVYSDYQGDILLNGEKKIFKNARDAEHAGISIIHQELNLVQDLSIAENIFLGKELLNRFGLLDHRRMIEQSKTVLERLDLYIDPSTLVSELKIGQQQLIEIAKALLEQSQVIIMDEPTSAISNKEVEDLVSIITRLRQEGKVIVYISHKLQELLRIADNFVVMRDGHVVGGGSMEGVGQDELIALMSGRNSITRNGLREFKSHPIFSLKNFRLKNPVKGKADVVANISFEISKGEVVGLYGLMGAGRTELLESIFGLHPKNVSGEISVDGKIISIVSPEQAIHYGFALVPEDRKKHGLHVHHPVRENISMSILKQLQKWGIWMDDHAEEQLSSEKVTLLSIKAQNDKMLALNLSGGNQQKVVLAKWMATNPSILLLDEPTRGVDVQSKAEIHALIQNLASQGIAVLIVSSEIPEILTVSDRILVMCEGKITLEIPCSEADEKILLKYAIPQESTL